jgi:hypothetical protein
VTEQQRVIEEFLESVKAQKSIVDYRVLDDGSCDIVLQPALKNIKIKSGAKP